jgi:phosphoribosylanthranilate isomerase
MITKICGITSIEDARVALDLGANALGFNFWPSSPRHLTLASAWTILDELHLRFRNSSFLSVGVLVGLEGWQSVSTDVLQIHGLHSPPNPALDRRVWFATGPESSDVFAQHEIIIDSSWGQGRVPDWDKVALVRRPYILSGGLTPENVGEAICRLQPAGVDVCSGVESRPGRKDYTKMKRFLREVERALR